VRELREILRAWRRLEVEGGVGVLASVVHAEGSTYRRPGARVLVLPDERSVGLLSGGCLEGDLLLRARSVRESGETTLVRYDGTADDLVWGLGLGCAGIVDVLLEPVDAERPGPLAWLESCLEARRPGVLATVLESSGELSVGARFVDGAEEAPPAIQRAMERARSQGRSCALEHGGSRVLVEHVEPPLPLLVLGAGPDAAPVVGLAVELGWDVTVVDGRAAYARRDHFPGAREVLLLSPEAAAESVSITHDTVAIVMTHHYLHDKVLLRWLLTTPARYVGVLGPRQRTLDLLGDLRDDGFEPSEESLTRLHAPAGLDIGSDGAHEIALSLVAEVRAVLAGRRGGLLRDRKGPLHDPVA
jgi:xanthine/CO dehydrogenase XdhC/CoxF family maturation factor